MDFKNRMRFIIILVYFDYPVGASSYLKRTLTLMVFLQKSSVKVVTKRLKNLFVTTYNDTIKKACGNIIMLMCS